MAKRWIGIDVGSSHIRAVQLTRTADTFTIERVFTAQARRSTDSVPDMLKSFIKEHGFDRLADIAVALPSNHIFYSTIETNSPIRQGVMEDSTIIPQDQFPMANQEALTHVYCRRPAFDGSGGQYCAGVVAASKESLSDRLNFLSRAGIRPNLVDAPIFAVCCAVAANYPEVTAGDVMVACVDDSHLSLAVIQDQNILAVRNVLLVAAYDTPSESALEEIARQLAQEIQITWQKALGDEVRDDSRVYLACARSVSEPLEAMLKEKLRCRLTVADPTAKVGISQNRKADCSICLAEGLALRAAGLSGTGVNFLDGYQSVPQPAFNLKKEVTVCTALAAAIVVFWTIGLFVQLLSLESHYARLKEQMKTTFQQTLPEEKNVVNPVVQLQQKLDSFRRENQLYDSFRADRPGPLDVLHSISVNTPRQGQMKADDVLITTDSVRIMGRSDSFDSVYRWQRLLQQTQDFSIVDIKDAQIEPGSDDVHFTILLSAN